MKKISLLLICAVGAVAAQAQSLELSMSAGTGKTYLVEGADNSVNVNHGLPLSMMTELKFTPAGRSWGIKLRLHSRQSKITGENWIERTPLNGTVHSKTTSLLLENDVQMGKLSYGFNFGLGMTRERIEPNPLYGALKITSTYPSLVSGGHLSYRISRDFDLQLQPVLLWHDPFHSIGFLTGNSRANLAGDDLSAVVNLGVRYRLTNSKRRTH